MWGDTVNTASRLESHGVPGRIQVSAEVAERLEGQFRLSHRGPVELRGKGDTETYLLDGELTSGVAAAVAADPAPTQ